MERFLRASREPETSRSIVAGQNRQFAQGQSITKRLERKSSEEIINCYFCFNLQNRVGTVGNYSVGTWKIKLRDVISSVKARK